jgi:hypothetical protein
MATLVSVFDHSYEWAIPYSKRGWYASCIDILNDPSVDLFDINYEWIVENVLELFDGMVDGLVAAPPCTDFTNAGAQYFPSKDANGRTYVSCLLVSITLQMVDALKPNFWVLENPVGRLPKLFPQLGKPQYFDPCDYSGWFMTDDEIAYADELRFKKPGEFFPSDIDFIKTHNLYTKKTGLWGDFVMPEKKRVEPIRTTDQGSWIMSHGGKSQKTKSARSVTPNYFAEMFYRANCNSDLKDDEFYDEYGVYSGFETSYSGREILMPKSRDKQLELFLV